MMFNTIVRECWTAVMCHVILFTILSAPLFGCAKIRKNYKNERGFEKKVRNKRKI